MKKVMSYIFISFFILCSSITASAQTIHSPDGSIGVSFNLNSGVPEYNVTYNGAAVINPSRLGFKFNTEGDMTGNFSIQSTSTNTVDSAWTPVLGQSSSIRNNYNELVVRLQEASGELRLMNLYFRVFDDGVGFRYELPDQPNLGDFEIISEETYFEFTGNHTAWFVEDHWDSYERDYKQSNLAAVVTDGANTPVTFRTATGLHLSLHEADLTDWAGMTVKGGTGNTLKATLVPWHNSNVLVKGSTPHVSPWRTLQISETAGGLIESNMILNLNDPPTIADTSWIVPRKYMGLWWGMITGVFTWHADRPAKHMVTTERAKRYIDAAASNGMDGLLMEGWNKGWAENMEDWRNQNFTEPYPDVDMVEISNYAAARGIKLIGHHETGGNIPNYMDQIHDAFDYYKELGIDAVKTGYVTEDEPVYLKNGGREHHHGQYMVNHYQEVAEIAATYGIMINAHEPIKPTGKSRTYPNFITREGARGGEFNHFVGMPPYHSTVLPFTRILGGPMDYTPGLFDTSYSYSDKRFATRAHQIALCLVLWSPLVMASDFYQAYTDEAAFQFIRNLPVGKWDETKILTAEIGEYIVTARRKGDNWYLGGVTDKNSRIIDQKLSFLNSGTTYDAHIYADSATADYVHNPKDVTIISKNVTSNSTLTLDLKRGGGVAIEFYPEGSGPAAPYGSAGTIVSGQKYKILAKHSSRALDVQYVSQHNGANVHQWEYVGGTNQQWTISEVGDGYYNLINVNSGKALEVSAAGLNNGDNVQQWNYVGASQQQWELRHITGSFYKIFNRNSGKVLDVSARGYENGYNVQQWDDDPVVPNQIWSLELVDPLVNGGTYKVIAKHSSRALEVQNASQNNGANVHQREYVGGANQQWTISDVGSGYYALINVNSDKALNVNAGGLDNGDNVEQSDYVGQHQQQWKIEHISGSSFKIINRNSGRALDVSGSGHPNGSNVHQWENLPRLSQVWWFGLL